MYSFDRGVHDAIWALGFLTGVALVCVFIAGALVGHYLWR